MKDIVFAGFAQLSYLNWHKLELNARESKKLREIFKDIDYFERLKNGDYAKIYPKGQDYLRIEEGKKIYHKSDARAYFLYSEDKVNGEKKPKYSEFGEWEFIEGYNHMKIFTDTVVYYNGRIKLSRKDSGFQASVFKKGNDIIIAYRGTDEMVDWIKTNNALGIIDTIPDALTCAVYVYNKIKMRYANLYICAPNTKIIPEENNIKIHITGHSMGGALAQYVGVYAGEDVTKTVTWNALGIDGEKKAVLFDKTKREHLKTFKENYAKLNKNSNKINIINYYMGKDLTPAIKERTGEVVIVDGKDKILNSFAEYHSVTNFIPFFGVNGNIVEKFLDEGFVMNGLKSEAIKNKKLKIDKNSKNDKIFRELLLAASNKKSGNLFYYLMEKNANFGDGKWYAEAKDYAEIGKFNNFGDIAGVIGGIPLKVSYNNQEYEKLPQKKIKQYHVPDSRIYNIGIAANRESCIVVGNTEIGMSASIRTSGENM